jgi:glycosyltransferase involved in cell wall biosynthesis
VRTTRVLVIAYGGESKPSTRLRILQYLPSLKERGFTVDCLFVSQGRVAEPIPELDERLGLADVVFVQRVLTRDILRALRRARKPVVFDVDDAIHLIRQSQYPRASMPRGIADKARNAYRIVARGSRYHSGRKRRLDEMLNLATTAIVGNQWLFEDLGLSKERGVVIPTSVFLDGVPMKEHRQRRAIVVGWIGVRSNLYHLDALRDAFAALRRRYENGIELMIVSSAVTETPLVTRFTPWSLVTEADSVLGFDIGIMPLQDDPFSRGKCAFKAVFCMSRGVPVVASPVGANTALVDHGANGWLAAGTKDWVEGISVLTEDVARRAEMGASARETIEQSYSAERACEVLAQVLPAAAA